MSSILSNPFMLSYLSWEEIEILLLCEHESSQRRERRSRRSLFDLDSMDDDFVVRQFRFRKDHISRLARALRLPLEVTVSQGISCSREEALCTALRRLAYPNGIGDLGEIFGRHRTTLSLITTEVLTHVIAAFGHLLRRPSCHKWLTSDCLQTFSKAVAAKGAPLENCWAFLDCTERAVCRPKRRRREDAGSQETVKYQSIMCPNGIVCHLAGPYPGRRHDAGICRDSELLSILEEVVRGQDSVVYGHRTYPLRSVIGRPFEGANLTPEKLSFNAAMNATRQCAEWGFEKIFSEFGFVDFRKNQKLLKQNVPMYFRAATILTNCHTCLYGSRVGTHFELSPPSLEDYLVLRS